MKDSCHHWGRVLRDGRCGQSGAAGELPLRIVVINHGYPLGRGVAYGTKQPEHLLNVAVQHVGVSRSAEPFPRMAGHAAGVCRRSRAVLEQFVPRKTDGDYLQALLYWHTKGVVICA